MAVDITLFTDPACPFAFSAEPNRQRLRWYYGDQLRWRLNMIVLTLEPGEDAKLAEGAPGLQRKYGMPIDPRPYARTFSSEPACRAVVAARLNAPGAEAPLLRRLRVRAMLGGLLDDPALLAAAATDVGLDPDELERWMRDAGGRGRAARGHRRPPARPRPPPARLDHKLGGPPRRAALHRAELRARPSEGRTFSIPGFNPVEVYETAMANFAPDSAAPSRSRSSRCSRWADRAAGHRRGHRDHADRPGQDPRRAQPRAATPIPAGADFYWTAR